MAERKKIGGVTRREMFRIAGAAGALIMSPSMSSTEAFQGLSDRTAADLDHIMWGARDLDAGVAFLEAKSGVRAVFGGVHPKRGTRNALLSLGKGRYLEILALDPAQTNAQDVRARELEHLTSPRILTWAAATRDIDTLDKKLRSAGLQTSGVVAGSREKPDGTVLRWKTLAVGEQDEDIVPFVIEWDPASKHPSLDSPGGCTIRELRLEHPDPAKVNRLLEAMGLRVRARRGARARITALLATPKGDFELT
jgi:hypothetical protein